MKNLADLIAFLLEALSGRTGKWDVVKAALSSKDLFVRRTAVILALVPPVIATLTAFYLAVGL